MCPSEHNMTTPDAGDASPSSGYSGDQDEGDMAEMKLERVESESPPSQQSEKGHKPHSNSKDPQRPRRKKARRACFSCQRAHLTCADERPCPRCVERKIAHSCQDGTRKRAKYLAGTPNEALIPPSAGGRYPNVNRNSQTTQSGTLPQPNSFYAEGPSNAYNPYTQNPISPPVQDGPVMPSYSHRQTPLSPPFSQTHQATGSSNPTTVAQASHSQIQQQQLGGPLFDPSDPALFNFDISSLNFGNHYGALEFGMLGHMTSGVTETPSNDNSMMNPLNQAANAYNPQISSGSFTESSGIPGGLTFTPDGVQNPEWQSSHSRNGSMQIQTPNNTPLTTTLDSGSHRHDSLNGPHSFVIAQGPSSISSASPASTDANSGYDHDNPLLSAAFFANSSQHKMSRGSASVNRQGQQGAALQSIPPNIAMRKRPRDFSYIYDGIKAPYPYQDSYHYTLALMKQRLPQEKFYKVVKAFMRFRPNLTAYAADLDRNDLIHTEKTLQRGLVMIENSFPEIGSPYLVCRRSGEVVLVNSEFSILTGWPRDTLLGKQQNFNVNFRSLGSLNKSGNSSVDRSPNIAGQESEQSLRPVTISEIMDEDSVVDFWESYSHLAFEDSHGRVKLRTKILRYLSKEDMEKRAKARGYAHGNGYNDDTVVKQEHMGTRIGLSGDESPVFVDCTMWFHIEFDMFSIPHLVKIIVLPTMPSPR